ncbi:MAG TPA: hypothetical protein VFV58_20560 [Blastocatellia bacterium]|jgi:hypothetical protein|nr:hypothetical protein [Blastocatellia bacterium]
MKRRRIILAVSAAAAFLVFYVLYYLYGGSAVPKGQQPLLRLNSSNLSSLKAAFNGSANSVRVLVMLSPT